MTYRWIVREDMADSLLQEVDVLDVTWTEVVDIPGDGIRDPLDLPAEVRDALDGLQTKMQYVSSMDRDEDRRAYDACELLAVGAVTLEATHDLLVAEILGSLEKGLAREVGGLLGSVRERVR